MSDFSTKKAFLKHLDSMLPDDAHFYEFRFSFNSTAGVRGAAVPGVVKDTGLLITELQRHPITVDGRMARYTVEGKL